ncbi:MAG: hypothetical protein JXC33_06935 [Deltaproteobacteria bacterium]|nr:hypothetical protein [Deltaproteobacteria bacterium]
MNCCVQDYKCNAQTQVPRYDNQKSNNTVAKEVKRAKDKKTYHYKWWKKGGVNCRATVDTFNQVDESNEKNNSSPFSFMVNLF